MLIRSVFNIIRCTAVVGAGLLISQVGVASAWAQVAEVRVFGNAPAATTISTQKTNSPEQTAITLLADFRVLRELKCTLEQRERIEDLLDELTEAMPEGPSFDIGGPGFQGGNAIIEGAEIKFGGNIPDENIQEKKADDQKDEPSNPWDEYRAEATRTGRELREKVLTAAQKQRLDQISLRLLGPAAFESESVKKGLKLTAKQIEVVQKTIEATHREIAERGTTEINSPVGVITVPAPLPRKDLYNTLDEAVETVIAKLTADQKKTWERLVGPELTHIPRANLFSQPGMMGGPMVGGNAVFFQAGGLLPAVPLLPAEPAIPADLVPPQR